MDDLISDIRLRIALRRLERKGIPPRYVLDILQGTPFIKSGRRLWIIADNDPSSPIDF